MPPTGMRGGCWAGLLHGYSSHAHVSETYKFISRSQHSSIFHSILKLPGIKILAIYSFTCNLIFISTSNRDAYCKCQRIIYYAKLISYVNDSLFREETLLILVGLLEHYDPLKFFNVFGYLVQDLATLKQPVQIISQSSGVKRIILFNSGINSTLAQMNMSVVLNYNEMPVKACTMGTFHEFILINVIRVTICCINNDQTTKIKYHQLLLNSYTTVIFFPCAQNKFLKEKDGY